MASAYPSPPTEPCGGVFFDGKPMNLVLAPGTLSGYKRVKRIDDSTFQACRTVDGGQQHVWTSDDPRECAYVLARLELDPAPVEVIKSACKAAAKLRTRFRRAKRKQDQLHRDINRMYESLIAKPKRAREAHERALAEWKAARVCESDEWYNNL